MGGLMNKHSFIHEVSTRGKCILIKTYCKYMYFQDYCDANGSLFPKKI